MDRRCRALATEMSSASAIRPIDIGPLPREIRTLRWARLTDLVPALERRDELARIPRRQLIDDFAEQVPDLRAALIFIHAENLASAGIVQTPYPALDALPDRPADTLLGHASSHPIPRPSSIAGRA